MPLGPSLVIRGSILGIAFFIFTALVLSADQVQATTLPVPANLLVHSEPLTTKHTDDACNLSSVFPNKVSRWCETIHRFAAEFDLPPDLVAAVIWQESGGDPDAYSKSGAVGLMQVMPRDGIASGFMCINGPCFSQRPTIQELLDPDFNIKYGVKMLARLAQRHGDIREALKSYGPMNIGYSYADRVLGLYQRALDHLPD